MFPQQTPELMIISTIHNKPCKYTPGDHYNFMSIVNKQVRTAFLPSFRLLRLPVAAMPLRPFVTVISST